MRCALSPAVAQLHAILVQLQSPDNAVRGAAEQPFNQAKEHKGLCLDALAQLNVQLKADLIDGSGKKVDADNKRFTQLLRAGGYKGWVALEYEAPENPVTAIPRHLKELRTLFSA